MRSHSHSYRRADVYLLDDPLSAVDAIVARHLFEEAIGSRHSLLGERNATRLLVTHSLEYLVEADLVVVLEGDLG